MRRGQWRENLGKLNDLFWREPPSNEMKKGRKVIKKVTEVEV